MGVKERLVELLDNAIIDSDDNYGFPNTNQVADRLIANGVTMQEHGYWETVVEVKDNTVCGNGVKIEYKRCSCCKNPAKFFEDDFCGSCGAKLDLPNHQKAEIEELQKYKHDYYVLKAEAIKEFAEELLEGRLGVVVVKDRTDEYARGYFDAIEFVDGKVKELVTEMIGDGK